ncbi:acyloxyacyl hydrolase [Aquicella lusitana]|uniref:Lipid A 3-O-deacylase PagL n=1 Tax=Aquicella lusitana TaxID=254246 RepID=A0A370GGD5_9COXI|nr:acyloxyacyl hydrolase [Aquicella lusitana]RDI42852.1 lipid A 3-O-deacylase PagL [Aquicella lusitana]VVC73095.1 Lipid A deacylase PagL [Aquicella lusitana]
MTGRKFYFIIVLLSLLPALSLAAPYYGANFSYTLITKEPPSLHGYQLMLNYDPQRFKWRQFNVYFDGGFSHFWVTNTPYYTTLNIYSIAPVVRYTFKKRGPVLPYLELSIGLSYLNHTRLDDRNLGIHFAFQDRAGIGAFFGASERLSIGVHAVHYSNARLSAHNSGITVPLLLDVGYRFN